MGVYRYYYTRRIRDARLWHRRYFEKQTPPPPPPVCSPNGTLQFDLNQVIPKGVTECADQAAQNYSKWQDNLENSLAAYQTSGKPPASLFGPAGSLGGMVCDQMDTNRQ